MWRMWRRGENNQLLPALRWCMSPSFVRFSFRRYAPYLAPRRGRCFALLSRMVVGVRGGNEQAPQTSWWPPLFCYFWHLAGLSMFSFSNASYASFISFSASSRRESESVIKRLYRAFWRSILCIYMQACARLLNFLLGSGLFATYITLHGLLQYGAVPYFPSMFLFSPYLRLTYFFLYHSCHWDSTWNSPDCSWILYRRAYALRAGLSVTRGVSAGDQHRAMALANNSRRRVALSNVLASIIAFCAQHSII